MKSSIKILVLLLASMFLFAGQSFADLNYQDIDLKILGSLGTPPAFVKAWGTEGSGNGQFISPSEIATDSSGNVYVVDLGNQRIEKFTSDGTYQSQWPCGSTLSIPSGITIDNKDRIIVVLGNLEHDTPGAVLVTNTNGAMLNSMTLSSNNQELNEELAYPHGVAAGQGWDVFVATNYHVVKYNSSNFNPITSWGGQGSGNGKFYGINGIAVDSNGNVYVIEGANHRVQKFDSNGNYLTQWGSEGSGPGQFLNPEGIAVDPSGNVYVSDVGNDCVQKFDANGKLLTKWGKEGSGNGEFKNPQDLAVRAGNIYVADASNHRIQKFQSHMFSAPFRIIKKPIIKLPTPEPPVPTTILRGPSSRPKIPEEQLTPVTTTTRMKFDYRRFR